MSPEESNTDCIFCKIANGEVPSELLYEDEDVVVFSDINPLTPVHLLVVTKKHIPSLAEMAEEDLHLISKMAKAAKQVAREQGIADKGYRLTINSGAEAGQIVPHIHMHLMGGRPLDWKH